MTKQQIEKYLKEKCSLTEIFVVFPHVRDWIVVAYGLSKYEDSLLPLDQDILKLAVDNIQSTLCKDWETVRKELVEQPKEK